ncbi:MAG: hypothetical protein HGB04_07235 [Chlorobiaceae bacterium]|nr:hypothetical protein [Chlorobiaceae bacterium]
MARDIPISELRPCDVLLYHGDSVVSQVIQWFDGTEYGHASIYDGEMVVEAIAEGVVTNDVASSAAGSLFVDVWRMRKDGHFIGSPGLPEGPVLDVVAKYSSEGGRYAAEELLLLALLCTTRRLPMPFLRWALDRASSWLEELVDEEREPMICSELVFRCFSEAGGEYYPRIRGVDIRAKVETLHMPGQPLRRMSPADREVAEFLDRYAAARSMGSRDRLLMAAVEADPNFITPGDLKRSPDFTKVGRLRLPS